MGKLPWFQFYPNDWKGDGNLSRCSKAAKGVWIDMLCLMSGCEERGVLASSGKPWSDQEIAEAVGGDTSVALACIAELLAKGVASRNAQDAVFSRRMVADEQKRRKCSDAGKRGGGNPTFKGHSKGGPKGTSKVPPNLRDQKSESEFSGQTNTREKPHRHRNPEPLPVAATSLQEAAEASCARLMQRDLRSNETAEIVRWCVVVETLPDVPLDDGSGLPMPDLAVLCFGEAERARVNGSVRAVIGYVESIRDRCARQRCLPGQMREAEPANLTPIAAAPEKSVEELLAMKRKPGAR